MSMTFLKRNASTTLVVWAGIFLLAGLAEVILFQNPFNTLSLLPFAVGLIVVASGIGIRRDSPWSRAALWACVPFSLFYAGWLAYRLIVIALASVGLAAWGPDPNLGRSVFFVLVCALMTLPITGFPIFALCLLRTTRQVPVM